MAFRRAKSTGGNATAEQARAALVRAFEAADLDRSGMIGAYCTPSSAPELQHEFALCPSCVSRLAPFAFFLFFVCLFMSVCVSLYQLN